jgi:hypothetical protein
LGREARIIHHQLYFVDRVLRNGILITKGVNMDRPSEPWSIKVCLKSRGRLKLDLDVLVFIMHLLGTPPTGEYLKSPQPVPLRLRAFFDREIPFPNVREKYTRNDKLKSVYDEARQWH